ncbi:MAG: VWA domain-containing protein [Acidimicrobiales bacterium]
MSFLHPDRLALLLAVVALAGAYAAVQRRNRARSRDTPSPPATPPSGPPGVYPPATPGPCWPWWPWPPSWWPSPNPRAPRPWRGSRAWWCWPSTCRPPCRPPTSPPPASTPPRPAPPGFVEGLPEGLHVGLVAFDGTARLAVAPTTDRAAVVAAIGDLAEGPGTAAGEGIATSLAAVQAALSPTLLASGEDLPASIVLLSDGATTVGRSAESAAAEAAKVGVPVTTISFGTPDGIVTFDGETVRVPADPETMRAVAEATGARSFEAASADELGDVYADISTAVGTTTERREVTRSFVGLAVVALLGAGALGLATTGRVL